MRQLILIFSCFILASCISAPPKTLSSSQARDTQILEIAPSSEVLLPGTLVLVRVPWGATKTLGVAGLTAKSGSATMQITATLVGDNQFKETTVGEVHFSRTYGASWSYSRVGEYDLVVATKSLMSSEGSYRLKVQLLYPHDESADLYAIESVLKSSRVDLSQALSNNVDPFLQLPASFSWKLTRHDEYRSVFRASVTDASGAEHYYTLTVDRYLYPGDDYKNAGEKLVRSLATKTVENPGIQTVEGSAFGNKNYLTLYYSERSNLYFTKNVGYWKGPWFIFAQLRQVDKIDDPAFFDNSYGILEQVRFDDRIAEN